MTREDAYALGNIIHQEVTIFYEPQFNEMGHKLEHDRYLITEAIIKEKDEEIERLKAELLIRKKRYTQKAVEGKELKKTLSIAWRKQLKDTK